MNEIQLNIVFEKASDAVDYLNSCWGFLSALGSLVAAGVAIYIVISFSRWKKEKVFEKKSIIAEDTLDLLESSLEGVKQWLIFANSWLVFSKHSGENQANFNRLSDEEKEKFNKACSENPYEVNNFCRNFQVDLSKFIKAKNKALRLNDDVINQRFALLESILKPLPSKLARMHHISFPEKEKEIAREYLQEKADKAIEEEFTALQKQLSQIILFEQ